jgi:hypothetical protein
MPSKLKPAIEKTYPLPETDKILENEGEPSTVTIIQARQGAHDTRMELWKEFSKKWDDEGLVSLSQSISPAAVRRKEVFLTLRGCNIEREDGSALFPFPDLSESKFTKAWADLPPAVADEIHRKVLDLNPLWDNSSGEDS